MDIHRMQLVVDRDADLAPQVIVLREAGAPWAWVERLTGRRKNRLEEMVQRWKRHQREESSASAMRL